MQTSILLFTVDLVRLSGLFQTPFLQEHFQDPAGGGISCHFQLHVSVISLFWPTSHALNLEEATHFLPAQIHGLRFVGLVRAYNRRQQQ